MAAFAVSRECGLSPEQAWQRLVDWPAHARFVPFTSITVHAAPAGGDGVGAGFVARTKLGRYAFDDPMEIVEWDPPRHCRIEKRGSVVLGWAELTVEPTAGGSRVTWREEATPAKLPRFAAPAATWSGRLLFTRVLRGLLAADAAAR